MITSREFRAPGASCLLPNVYSLIQSIRPYSHTNIPNPSASMFSPNLIRTVRHRSSPSHRRRGGIDSTLLVVCVFLFTSSTATSALEIRANHTFSTVFLQLSRFGFEAGGSIKLSAVYTLPGFRGAPFNSSAVRVMICEDQVYSTVCGHFPLVPQFKRMLREIQCPSHVSLIRLL